MEAALTELATFAGGPWDRERRRFGKLEQVIFVKAGGGEYRLERTYQGIIYRWFEQEPQEVGSG